MCMFYADLMPQDIVKTGSQPDNSSKNFNSNWEDKCYSESLTVWIAGTKLDLLYQATFPNVRYDDIISFFSILQMVPMYQVTHSANVKKKQPQNCFSFIFSPFFGNATAKLGFNDKFRLPRNFISHGQIVSQNIYILLSNFVIALIPCC